MEDKINYLKKTILKNINRNIINNIQKIQNNTTPKSKEYNFNSFSSSPETFIKNLESKKRYNRLKLEKRWFSSNQNKSENKNFYKNEIIRITKKRRSKQKNNKEIFFTEENENNKNNKNLSRFNYTKKNFCINSAARLSRTPNNILRNLNNKLILEQDIKNNLDRNRYNIKEKNFNNYVTNNNNINININFTNIIKKENEKYNEKEEYSLKQNKEKSLNSYKGINELFRFNKFLDNSIKGKNYFINTSVNTEKKIRETESENNRNLFLYSNNDKNLYDKYNRYNNKKENSVNRKIKDNRYLKIKAKNKKFNDSEIKKINSNNNKSNKNNCLKSNNFSNFCESNINQKQLKAGNNLNIIIHPKINRNINIETINNQNLNKSKNNINYIKINYSKKYINDYNKRQNFKHLNTDTNIHFNNKNNNIYQTNINFFSNRKNNLISSQGIKEKNINLKNTKIISTDINSNIKNNYLNPFDLNSIIINKEENDIKKEIFNFLESKNIKVKNGGNNKFICSKNDMELELRIINLNHEKEKRIYIIKTFHKVFKSIKSKNFYLKLIPRLINHFK